MTETQREKRERLIKTKMNDLIATARDIERMIAGDQGYCELSSCDECVLDNHNCGMIECIAKLDYL